MLPGSHLELKTKFFSSVWQCGAPSLTRGWVCNLLIQLLLGLVRAVTHGSKSRRTQTIFYCLIWDSTNLKGQVPIFTSPKNRVAQLNPRVLGSLFLASYNLQGYGGGILTLLHTGLAVWSHPQCMQRPVGWHEVGYRCSRTSLTVIHMCHAASNGNVWAPWLAYR
jgi:hypothetical protein